MHTGNINVQTENIFPIIKKFLYSDHEIFLRELVANAVDANLKLKTLSQLGEYNGDIDNLKVEVSFDKDAKTITVEDTGLGMTGEEVEKYINQIAFSGAEEFVKQYQDKADTGVIGHFGLGFYSAFMVSDKVEIFTKSKNEGSQAVHWSCDGSVNYTLQDTEKESRGTKIVLHIAEDSLEFLEEARLKGILDKYCKFLPVEIVFGTVTEKVKGEDDKEEEVVTPRIINNPSPAWTKSPSSLKEEDYQGFYRELYPMAEEPLFHIHMNVDYPFNLTGILYFPKVSNQVEIQKNKIQLYCNQVFVTDNVEGIMPDFLSLMHGVVDSTDIPLNVSRSYLQADGNVKKLSSHITKKVADKLVELFKNDRKAFEEKWDDLKLFIEFGTLTDEKFYDRVKNIILFKSTSGEYFTWEEFAAKTKENQSNKDGQHIVLYTNEDNKHFDRIANATERGYVVLDMESQLSAHFIANLEQKLEKVSFSRIDADSLDKLIDKGEEIPSKLNDEEKEAVKGFFTEKFDKEKFDFTTEALSETEAPLLINQMEFIRRMKEQQKTGGGNMNMFGAFPEKYSVVINTNHPVVGKIAQAEADEKAELTKHLFDIALLGAGLLTGEELAKFISTSIKNLG